MEIETWNPKPKCSLCTNRTAYMVCKQLATHFIVYVWRNNKWELPYKQPSVDNIPQIWLRQPLGNLEYNSEIMLAKPNASHDKG